MAERGGEGARLVGRRHEQALAPARHQHLEPRDHARDDRAPAAHRLEQHHPEAGALARGAEDVGRGVVARAVPVDATGPLDGGGDLGREPAGVVAPQRAVADHAQARVAVARAPQLVEGLEHDPEAVARVEAAEEEDDRIPALAQRVDRPGAR